MIFINIEYRVSKRGKKYDWRVGIKNSQFMSMRCIYKHIHNFVPNFFTLFWTSIVDRFFFAFFMRFYFPISMRSHTHILSFIRTLFFVFSFCKFMLERLISIFFHSSDIYFYYKLSSILISACLDPATTGQIT